MVFSSIGKLNGTVVRIKRGNKMLYCFLHCQIQQKCHINSVPKFLGKYCWVSLANSSSFIIKNISDEA